MATTHESVPSETSTTQQEFLFRLTRAACTNILSVCFREFCFDLCIYILLQGDGKDDDVESDGADHSSDEEAESEPCSAEEL